MSMCKRGDMHYCSNDCHGCPSCCHNVMGPAITGSPNVMVNGAPALRSQGVDSGMHSKCCGGNIWRTACGSPNCIINGIPAVRLNDCTMSCGGVGIMISSSVNTKVNM